jgi:cell division protein FtsQ
MSEERRRSPSSRPRQHEKRAEPAVKENSSKKKPQRGSLMNAALIAVLALLIAAGVFILGYYATSVRKITVEGNSILTDEQVINLAGLYTGRNIFSYDLGAAKRGIETNPYLKCTGIKRSLPNRLVISISERKEFAALLLGSSDYCVIDCTGFVLDIGRSEESVRGLLPVYGLSAMGIRVGMNIDADKGKLRPFTVM